MLDQGWHLQSVAKWFKIPAKTIAKTLSKDNKPEASDIVGLLKQNRLKLIRDLVEEFVKSKFGI
jgi:hypothetical protein